MRTIFVKVDSQDDVKPTAKNIERKWNFCPKELRPEDKITVTDMPDSLIFVNKESLVGYLHAVIEDQHISGSMNIAKAIIKMNEAPINIPTR